MSKVTVSIKHINELLDSVSGLYCDEDIEEIETYVEERVREIKRKHKALEEEFHNEYGEKDILFKGDE